MEKNRKREERSKRAQMQREAQEKEKMEKLERQLKTKQVNLNFMIFYQISEDICRVCRSVFDDRILQNRSECLLQSVALMPTLISIQIFDRSIRHVIPGKGSCTRSRKTKETTARTAKTAEIDGTEA